MTIQWGGGAARYEDISGAETCSATQRMLAHVHHCHQVTKPQTHRPAGQLARHRSAGSASDSAVAQWAMTHALHTPGDIRVEFVIRSSLRFESASPVPATAAAESV
eukprot:CAMPEP_0185562524 /NCGR_PEP_ID=MMETSP1381-20130426/61546_1 /TAXON_ID=298111 /ORGANISM="Pavlova sp., Strain CCMP459" /LENGTH=105 /DNA_ID=CAMNT_0028176369 /DNA_START=123 /DNA_END=437 /DNA_ORIENTATION=-